MIELKPLSQDQVQFKINGPSKNPKKAALKPLFLCVKFGLYSMGYPVPLSTIGETASAEMPRPI